MDDIFKRRMKQFAKGVAYRLVADAVIYHAGTITVMMTDVFLL
jgi:hypothetical protein